MTDERLHPQLPGSKHLTEHFLLALAVKHGGRFATFETVINAALVPGGQTVLHIIPTC
jgi:hypothetical protein